MQKRFKINYKYIANNEVHLAHQVVAGVSKASVKAIIRRGRTPQNIVVLSVKEIK
jgi:hypothetical protein